MILVDSLRQTFIPAYVGAAVALIISLFLNVSVCPKYIVYRTAADWRRHVEEEGVQVYRQYPCYCLAAEHDRLGRS